MVFGIPGLLLLSHPRMSKDQTLPIGSRESFTWIILETILCLVLDPQGNTFCPLIGITTTRPGTWHKMHHNVSNRGFLGCPHWYLGSMDYHFTPYMVVSENSGTPQSSISIGVSIINHPFWGTTILGNPHISRLGKSRKFRWKNTNLANELVTITSSRTPKRNLWGYLVIPIPSMYGMYTYIWSILWYMYIGKHTVHACYGIWYHYTLLAWILWNPHFFTPQIQAGQRYAVDKRVQGYSSKP